MSRTKWERLAILFAGPLMNLVLAVLILTVLFMIGLDRPAGLGDPPIIRFVAEDSPAASAGLRPGDQILALQGQPIETWSDALDKFMVSANDTLTVTLLREGEQLETQLVVEARGDEDVGFTGLFPAVQPQVASLMEGFPAEAAGIQAGDIIMRVNRKPVYHYTQLIKGIEAAEGNPLLLGILRDGRTVDVEVVPRAEEGRWLIGIQFNPAPTVTQQFSNPLRALSAATSESLRFTRLTFVILGRLVTGKASVRQMSGPIGIARISGETARRGAKDLFTFMAFLSLNLGILNLLPIPLLDGGHMAIISLEGLAGRDISLNVKERILQVGFVMLLFLMVTVLYVDLSKIESIGRFLPW